MSRSQIESSDLRFSVCFLKSHDKVVSHSGRNSKCKSILIQRHLAFVPSPVMPVTSIICEKLLDCEVSSSAQLQSVRFFQKQDRRSNSQLKPGRMHTRLPSKHDAYYISYKNLLLASP